jgi:chemotaxis protein methyltransferase CheR
MRSSLSCTKTIVKRNFADGCDMSSGYEKRWRDEVEDSGPYQHGGHDVSALTASVRLTHSSKLLVRESGLPLRAEEEANSILQTGFFRDPSIFASLRDNFFPRLLARHRATSTTHRGEMQPLKIWCAGCATGQEVYSIAMLLAEVQREHSMPPPLLLGTDISSRSIEHACRAAYRMETVLDSVPALLVQRYFQKQDGMLVVADELRSMCNFQVRDVCTPPSGGAFDLVLLRNVLPYIGQEQRSTVLEQVAKVLGPDSRLLLGASERVEDWSSLFIPQVMESCDIYRLAAA